MQIVMHLEMLAQMQQVFFLFASSSYSNLLWTWIWYCILFPIFRM